MGKTSEIEIFKSILGDILLGFVNEKRAFGYKYIKGARLLKQFDDYILINQLNIRELPKDLVLNWTNKRLNETDSTRSGRISIVRNLAKYMTRMGYTAYLIPDKIATINRYSYIPYIFTEKEIRSIFIACDNFPVSNITPYRHIVLALIIRMLYGCGFRISEVLNLKIDDIDLKNGVIHVREAKFGKERIIPMSNTLTTMCKQYSNTVHVTKFKDDFYFPSPYGGPYKADTIYKLYRDLLWSAGIPHSGKGPRLHDLRHTFAVHCLKRWVLNGEDLSNLLPYLTTYMGHSDLRGTEHYLKLTSDLYPSIISGVEYYNASIIPEVEIYEAN